MHQPKSYQPGKSSSPKLAGGGLKKPTYTGADRSRSASTKAQSPAYTQGKSGKAGY